MKKVFKKYSDFQRRVFINEINEKKCTQKEKEVM
jgi:hypothetical protein